MLRSSGMTSVPISCHKGKPYYKEALEAAQMGGVDLLVNTIRKFGENRQVSGGYHLTIVSFAHKNDMIPHYTRSLAQTLRENLRLSNRMIR
jgi:hypothetical protein